MDAWKRRVAALIPESSNAYLIALRITGSPALAEEAVQEAFAKLLERPLQDEGQSQAVVYLFKTVRGTAVNLAHSTRHRKQREDAYAVNRSADIPTPQQLSESSEVARAARQALSELPSDERIAVSMCCEQSMSRKVAAEVLDIPETTLIDRMQRGLEKLRLRLAAQGFAALTPLLIGEGLRGLGVPPAPSGLLRAVSDLAGGAAKQAPGLIGTKVAAKTAVSTGTKIVAGVVLASAVATAVIVAQKQPAPKQPAATTPVAPAPPASAPATPPSESSRILDDHEGPQMQWSLITYAAPLDFKLSKEKAHSGAQALRVAYQLRQDDEDRFGELFHPIELKKNDRVLRFYILSESSAPNASWTVQFRLRDGSCWAVDDRMFSSLKPGWNQIDIDLQKPPIRQEFGGNTAYAPTEAVGVLFALCAGSAVAFIDDFTIVSDRQ
jgi:RNA polymerase sigma-70 factor (ECF subfamily)